MTKKELSNRLESALKTLRARDLLLLQVDVNERSLTHKLAEYLEKEFHGYDVDCEYNRDHDQIKQLHLPSRRRVGIDDTRARTVFPDIIVHRRQSDQNFLVIEVKKTSDPNGKEFDLKKLNAYKTELEYTFAVFIKLGTGPSDAGTFEIEFI
jgi:hypothetical protein